MPPPENDIPSTSMPKLKAIEIETHPNPTASIIWLHGLGANGHDFEPIIPELELPSSLGVRFIFPHAPTMVVTINSGLLMPAWYDIFSHDLDRKVDTKQLLASADAVSELIEQEIERGIPSERIIIAGFSQGGAVGYQLALSYHRPLGGLIALSTYFATRSTIDYHAANTDLPIFIGHGENDNIVPHVLGLQAVDALEENRFSPVYSTYNMDHSVCLEEIKDISKWIQRQLDDEVKAKFQAS